MKRHLFQNRRTRLRLTLLVALSLLFQQFALATYVCPKLGAPAVNAALSMHCGDMAMTQPGRGDALCAQSCAQQPLTGQHAQLPHITPLLIPALLPSPQAAVITRMSDKPRWSEATSLGIGLVPPLRFRVLLI